MRERLRAPGAGIGLSTYATPPSRVRSRHGRASHRLRQQGGLAAVGHGHRRGVRRRRRPPRRQPALTSASDVAACAQLEQAIQAVSQLVGHTTEGITQAAHPKELAEQVGTAQQSLLDSAKLIELVHAPKPLAGSQRQFVRGLRMFAADFARGKASAAKGDMATATQQLTDEAALRKIQTSAKRIDDQCGA